jgi:localization factor PodJL
VKGIDPEVRTVAKSAARRAGMTLGEWLNSVILDQNEHMIDSPPVRDIHPGEASLSAAPQDPVIQRSTPTLRDDESRPAPDRRDDSAMRLQDIARQLAELAQKERRSAAQPLAPPRREADEEALARVLERIDDNERQTVEAFTAVNERLALIGQQIATMPRAEIAGRPEDVPGYSALETAIRNVVEHIEVSERRTRDSLKAMQDRLAELADQTARQPAADEAPRTGPVLAALEARVSELSNRLMRAETLMQAGLPEPVRREFTQIAERIEGVRASAEQMVKQAQGAAAGVARSEMREIENRVLAMLQETQVAAVGQRQGGPELDKLRGEVGGLTRRMDEFKANAATERDLNQLRLAVEHLSSRVAQGPDLRPLAEMDRRVGELGRRLDQVAATAGGASQISDIEDRMSELGQRLEEAMRQQADPNAMALLERNLAAIDERVARTENQLVHIETMEQAIRQLYGSLENSRETSARLAEEAAGRAVDRMLASGQPLGAVGPSPELRALEDGLRAVRESAAGAERRNQETLAAVHETLSHIVEKIAEIEAGGRSASAPSSRPFTAEPSAAAEPSSQHQAVDEPVMPEPAPAASASAPLSAGDDFIAAARRAAQAAATRPSALRAEFAPVLAQPEPESRLSFMRSRRKAAQAAAPGPEATADAARQAGASRRRRLLLAGVVLLAAVSAFAFNMLVKKPLTPAPETTIEAPAQQPTERPPERQGLMDLPSAVASNSALLPPPDTGTEELRSAAARGDATAQFVVATRYADGAGVAPDAAKAAFWYEQAAAGGLAPAQYRLGTLYERGLGVAQDAGLALSWYERAARQGNVKAMHNAAVILAAGSAGPADYGRALPLFRQAAERGLRDSQFNLAILLERGLGAAPDTAEAYFWYRLAASQGDAQAAASAAKLASAITPPERSRIAARAAAWTPKLMEDSANVVAVADPAWQEPDSSVLASGAAVPLSDAGAPPPHDLVTEAQMLLAELGFNVGTPDGKLGVRTVDALRRFQLQSGLEVTGEITPELLNEMRARAG